MSKLVNLVRKKVVGGILKFGMIQNGDKIIVAVSGGKDSLALLDVLAHLQHNSQFKFELIPVYIVPQVPGIKIFEQELIQVFKSYNLDYIIQPMEIPPTSKLKEGIESGQTCQWCTYARRIALFKLTERIGATKIAYGHHMDDIITTLFMNVDSSNRLKIMPPVNKMRKGDFSIIRPLARIRESDIVKYGNILGLVPLKAECPLEKISKRKKVSQLLGKIEEEMPHFVEKMFNAYINKIGNDFETDDRNLDKYSKTIDIS
ncbi:MAG: ATP-binding protein [Candidatus Absconditabacteria bacterium]